MEAKSGQYKTLDVQGAADLLGVRPSTVRKYVLERRLPYYKVGARITFDSGELIVWREQFHVTPRIAR